MSEPTEDDRMTAALILLTTALGGGAPAAREMIAAALAKERAKAHIDAVDPVLDLCEAAEHDGNEFPAMVSTEAVRRALQWRGDR